MATIKWRLKGKWLKNCSCNPGCPCDFWAPPTHHKCEGMLGMHVDEGFYGKTSMRGVTFLAQYHWPGPLHERSEEHTSELQSQSNLVCRLLLEKKKKNTEND